MKENIPEIKGSVLTSSSNGPAVIWHLNAPVIGAPYHTNEQGILDNVAILHSPYTDKTEKLLRDHQVSLIVLPRLRLDYRLNSLTEEEIITQFFPENTFSNALMQNKITVCGIKPLPLHENLEYFFIVYTVDFSNC